MKGDPSNDEEAVERVAKAIYDEQVRQAINAIEGLPFVSQVMVGVFRRMSAESFTARVVLLGSYLEQISIDLMRLHLRPTKSRSDDERIFGPNGPLGTFSSRIDLAFALHWIPEQTKSHLHAIRKVRNLFAHEAYKVEPFDDRVIDLLANIKIDTADIVTRANQVLEDGRKLPAKLNQEQEILLKLLFVTGEMMESLLVGLIASGFRVDPRSILRDWNELPANVREVRRNVTWSMLYMLQGAT